MDRNAIKNFWENNPCGQHLVIGEGKNVTNFRDFFIKYDNFRYSTERHILSNLDRIDFTNKKVLEIGIGQAADSQQIIDRGAEYFGLDVTQEACNRAILRFKIFNKPYKDVVCASATSLPFLDDYFDVIYSHGVLHHIPDIKKVVPELYRVLKKDGKLIIMVYAKHSLNYWFLIMILRRMLFLGLFFMDFLIGRKIIKNALYRKHLENAKKVGLMKYLTTDYFLGKNTDGPDNPYSRAYSVKEVREIFSNFYFYSFRHFFLNERHLSFLKFLPQGSKNFLSEKFGWHLWCYGGKR